MNSALALRHAQTLEPSPRFGPGTALQMLSGGVAAFFMLESYDRRRGVATYALQVVNETAAALICRTWVVTRTGDAVLACPVLLEIEPFSAIAMQIPVWPSDFVSMERAVAEITGDDVHCIVNAGAPPVRSKRATYAVVAMAALFVVLTLTGVAALLGAVPRIAAFAVPPMALAGTTVRAEYGASGVGTLAYEVLAPDGHRVVAETLADRSGSIPVALPPSADPGAYTLQMTMRGPLGNAKEVRVLNAVLPKIGSGAHIADVAVNPVVAKPGDAVNIAYAASGDGGYVRLLGSDGTIWAQKPFSPTGATQFVLPPTTGTREMRVLLHVTKGRSAAESSAGLLVAAPAAKQADTPAQIAGDDNPNAFASSAANGTFEVLTRTVKSGGNIHVRILSPRNGMRISVTDSQSHEVSGVNVGSDAETVTLKAPTVAVTGRYTVVANFTDGFGQESIVQPMTVRP